MLRAGDAELLHPAGPTYRRPVSSHCATPTGTGPTTAQAAHFVLLSTERQETDHTTQHVLPGVLIRGVFPQILSHQSAAVCVRINHQEGEKKKKKEAEVAFFFFLQRKKIYWEFPKNLQEVSFKDLTRFKELWMLGE